MVLGASKFFNFLLSLHFEFFPCQGPLGGKSSKTKLFFLNKFLGSSKKMGFGENEIIKSERKPVGFQGRGKRKHGCE